MKSAAAKAALDNTFVTDERRVRAAERAGGAVHMLAPPVRCPGEDMPCEPAPPLGADTDDILGRLGFAPEELARLRAAGAL